MGRRRKPIAEGGTRPHLDTCACGARVIRHFRANKVPIVLDAEPVEDGDHAIAFGFVVQNPNRRNMPADEPFYREHACPLAQH